MLLKMDTKQVASTVGVGNQQAMCPLIQIFMTCRLLEIQTYYLISRHRETSCGDILAVRDQFLGVS